jgi:2-polyprenyl-6-methoxyphenol hydroxylase-like FAD-dependent oxidoreductase
MDNNDQIIIIGAGIAGLSLAIQLAKKNIPCIVLEERTNFDGPTSGVRISAQGVSILEKIGIKNIGANTEHAIMHFGNIVSDFKVKTSAGKSPAIIVTRLAVFEKLLEKVKALDIEVKYGFNVSNATENTDGVIVTAENGQTIKGKYLVGADGVGSVVRKILNPSQSSGKRYAGYLGIGLIFPHDRKYEMSLFTHPKSNVGLASIGKINSADPNDNLFLWTHLHITEDEAKAMTNAKVIEMLTAKSEKWSDELKGLFNDCINNSKTILAHGPVYNGKVPAKWYSDSMFLIGDAAHPYGPGGQGISMALKDAEALCEMFVSGITDEKKIKFQELRAKEAKGKGEASEERNKPENQITTDWGVFYNGLLMKAMQIFKGGALEF